jgi:hypothetical protein
MPRSTQHRRAGGCVVIHHGNQYRVNRIEACSAQQGRSAYPAPFRQFLRATARKEFRLLRTDNSQTADQAQGSLRR